MRLKSSAAILAVLFIGSFLLAGPVSGQAQIPQQKKLQPKPVPIATPTISSVIPNSIQIRKGGQSESVTIKGSNLGAISSAQILLGGQLTSEVTSKIIEPRSATEQKVEFQASPRAPLGNYQIRAIIQAGTRSQSIDIPNNRFKLEVIEQYQAGPVSEKTVASNIRPFVTSVEPARVELVRGNLAGPIITIHGSNLDQVKFVGGLKGTSQVAIMGEIQHAPTLNLASDSKTLYIRLTSGLGIAPGGGYGLYLSNQTAPTSILTSTDSPMGSSTFPVPVSQLDIQVSKKSVVRIDDDDIKKVVNSLFVENGDRSVIIAKGSSTDIYVDDINYAKKENIPILEYAFSENEQEECSNKDGKDLGLVAYVHQWESSDFKGSLEQGYFNIDFSFLSKDPHYARIKTLAVFVTTGEGIKAEIVKSALEFGAASAEAQGDEDSAEVLREQKGKVKTESHSRGEMDSRIPDLYQITPVSVRLTPEVDTQGLISIGTVKSGLGVSIRAWKRGFALCPSFEQGLIFKHADDINNKIGQKVQNLFESSEIRREFGRQLTVLAKAKDQYQPNSRVIDIKFDKFREAPCLYVTLE